MLNNFINWKKIEKCEYPKDKWLLIETSDKAHHIAYYSSTYNTWICNSEFGGEPIWWTIVPSAPCLQYHLKEIEELLDDIDIKNELKELISKVHLNK